MCQFSSFAKELRVDILTGDGVAIGSCDFHCLDLLTIRIHGPLIVSHCSLFISHAVHPLCDLSFSSLSFFIWWYSSCTIVLFVHDTMFEACAAFPSLIFPVRGKKFMFAAWRKRIFLLCDFHALFCLIGPVMAAIPTVLEHYCQLCASCIHALARISPFATVAVFCLEMF